MLCYTTVVKITLSAVLSVSLVVCFRLQWITRDTDQPTVKWGNMSGHYTWKKMVRSNGHDIVCMIAIIFCFLFRLLLQHTKPQTYVILQAKTMVGLTLGKFTQQ